MISLEQVLLLETRIGKAIDYIKSLESEKEVLVSHNEDLQKKLDATQKRIDELEVLVMRFKEDQGRIEDGIIAALDRLSQFEEAFENSLKENSPDKKAAAKVREKQEDQEEIFFEISESEVTAQKNSELLDANSADVIKTNKQPEQTDQSSKESAVQETADSVSASEGELDIF